MRRMPTFYAEASLHKSSGHYRGTTRGGAFATQIVPQQLRPSSYLCWKACYACDRYGAMCDVCDRCYAF